MERGINPKHNPYQDKADGFMEKHFGKFFVFCVAVALGFLGVIVWAIIRVVLAVT